MTPIYSHPPSNLLTEHLKRVADNVYNTVDKRKINFQSVPKKVLAELGFIAGAVHDMGKGTKNFQLYLFGEDYSGSKNHALISAFAGYFLAVQYIENIEMEEELKTLLPYFVFIAVKRHHGNLKNFRLELCEELSKQEKILPVQIDNFFAAETEIIINERIKKLNLHFSWKDFSEFVKTEDYAIERSDFAIEYISNDAERTLGESIQNFYLHQIIYASLLYSDKSDVILKSDLANTESINLDAVKNYRTKEGWNNPTRDIDKKKNAAYQSGLNYLKENFDPEQHLYSVTMPTGLGKTVTSFALALEMKKMLNNPESRIIITIPFTSIIDQNYEVYANILDKPNSQQLLKHHHLAEPKYKESDDSERDGNESQFLIETWQSEVIVTTFVQLLECLYTNDKTKLMKLPNLANAIIILDEVQNIPYKFWKPVKEVFKLFGERLNCYFIMMSATQPLIFEPKKEIVELIPDYQNYFSFFNRTKLVNKTNEIVPLDDFIEVVTEHFEKSEKKDTLIILNSINVTRECFEKLTEIIPEEEANIYYLSTRISPFERKKIIEKIKESKELAPDERLPNIIVSTQMIEAGVDISVHTVFRAIAPLDSIIQAAGRANRYWENGDYISQVFIYKIEELEDVNGLIYGGILLNKTEKVLGDFKEIEEKDYLKLIEEYFTEIKKQADHSKDKMLPAMARLEFENVGKFEFIPDRKTNSIFVQLNKDAKKVWKKYVRLAENQELKSYERKKEFAKFKAEFYDYVVNAPVPYDAESINWDDEPQHFFYLWGFENPNSFYNYSETSGEPNYRTNIGFIPSKSTTAF